MPHTNSTTNYSLPQFLSTDKPAWLTDVNPAYAAIDTGMHNAQTAADNAQGDATQALTDAAAADGKATTADAKASGSIASIADQFDATATYAVNDLVIYNNLLYICTTAVTTPGAWTGSTNWNRTTLENQLSNISIDSIGDINDVDLTGLTAGDMLQANSVGGNLIFKPISMLPRTMAVTNLLSAADTNDTSAVLNGNMLIVNLSYSVASTTTSWLDIVAINGSFDSSMTFMSSAVTWDGCRYVQAYMYSANQIRVRVLGANSASTYRGQIVIPLISA